MSRKWERTHKRQIVDPRTQIRKRTLERSQTLSRILRRQTPKRQSSDDRTKFMGLWTKRCVVDADRYLMTTSNTNPIGTDLCFTDTFQRWHSNDTRRGTLHRGTWCTKCLMTRHKEVQNKSSKPRLCFSFVPYFSFVLSWAKTLK